MKEKQFTPPTPEEIAAMQKRGEKMMTPTQAELSKSRSELHKGNVESDKRAKEKDPSLDKFDLKLITFRGEGGDAYSSSQRKIQGTINGHEIWVKERTTVSTSNRERKLEDAEGYIDGIKISEKNAASIFDKFYPVAKSVTEGFEFSYANDLKRVENELREIKLNHAEEKIEDTLDELLG